MLISRVIVNTPKVLKRNIGIMAPALQKASDPIQQLFLDKIREYKEKNAGGKLFESDPDLVKLKAAELEKIQKQFNISSPAEMANFPSFKFSEPVVDTKSVKTEKAHE